MQFQYHAVRAYEGVETSLHLRIMFAHVCVEELHGLYGLVTDVVVRCELLYWGVQILKESSSKV
jgi:hypothetical protein